MLAEPALLERVTGDIATTLEVSLRLLWGLVAWSVCFAGPRVLEWSHHGNRHGNRPEPRRPPQTRPRLAPAAPTNAFASRAALYQLITDAAFVHQRPTGLLYLCVDEADKLLNMDFEDELNKILQAAPKDRNTFLFSATMTSKVAKLQRASLSNPVKVEVSSK